MTLFDKIANELSEKITNGKYLSGEEIPNEVELQKMYDVSRTTVRKAIDQLVDDGLVIRKRGGWIICSTINVKSKYFRNDRCYEIRGCSNK